MSAGLSIDLAVRLPGFGLEVAWESDDPALGVFGPSGAGKTTLLEALAGLRPAEGRIAVDGEVWLDSARGVRRPPDRRGVGWVPQESLLFPHRDVMGNVLMGRRRAARAGARALDPERVLEVLGIRGLERRAVASLSGGERRRVALARALCSAPRLLLLDEPLAALEIPLRRRILADLLRIRAEFGVRTILVSHEPAEIAVAASEAIVLRGGRVAARGEPRRLFLDPAVAPLARAEGFLNVLRGRVRSIDEGLATAVVAAGLEVRLPAEGLAPGMEVDFGLAGEDLILSLDPPARLSAQNHVACVVRRIDAGAGGIGGRGGAVDGKDSGGAAAGAVTVVAEAGEPPVPLLVLVTAPAVRRLDLRAGTRGYLIFKAQACRILAVTPAR